jgi:NAD(P)-dependent dehydrogenase (short-subunit alcohol dehydrogenase family)
MLVRGKVALITGAATGIGKTGAIKLAEQGAKVLVADLNDKEGQATVDQIVQAGSEAAFITVDLRSVEQVEKTISMATEIFGKLDILWHNAGVIFPGHIETVAEENYDHEMKVGLKAAVFATKFVVPVMKRTGAGSILYTSSMVGLRPSPFNKGYSITHGIEKAGLIMLMRCVTDPLARYNIRVNCICPGPVATDQWKAGQILQAKASDLNLEEYLRAGMERLPIKRHITEDEVVNAALFLLSDYASGITGVALPVDGGFSSI